MWAEEEHDRDDAYECQHACQQIDQAIGDQLLDVCDVAGDALHQIAFLLLAVPVQREALQVVKELVPEPGSELLADMGCQVEV